MNEVTDFLLEKQQELRLSDSDLLEMRARPTAGRGPNAALLHTLYCYGDLVGTHCGDPVSGQCELHPLQCTQEMAELKQALAEEQAKAWHGISA